MYQQQVKNLVLGNKNPTVLVQGWQHGTDGIYHRYKQTQQHMTTAQVIQQDIQYYRKQLRRINSMNPTDEVCKLHKQSAIEHYQETLKDLKDNLKLVQTK